MKYGVLNEKQLDEMLNVYIRRVNYNIKRDIKQWGLDEVAWETLSKDYAVDDFRVLSIDGKIVAAMAVVDEDLMYWPGVPKGESLYLHKICVDPQYEGHGYGDLMVSMFIEEGRQKGKKDVRLDVKAYKDALIRFYERCGFKFDKLIQVHEAFQTRLYRYTYADEVAKERIVFVDDVWPKSELTHTRYTVRALAHENDSYALLRIKGNDEFLDRNHLETIGGGIEEGESQILALHREVYEELGYLCKVESYITTIEDTYNLIHRKTVSAFYEVKLMENLNHTFRTESENQLFDSVEWVSADKLLDTLDYKQLSGVNYLVQRRDYTAAEMMGEQNDK